MLYHKENEMKIMQRTNLTIVCETEEAIREWTNRLAKFIEETRNSDGPPIVGSQFHEDEYLIANGADIEADKAAYALIKKEPIVIPISSSKDVPIDLSRIKVVEEPIEEPIK